MFSKNVEKVVWQASLKSSTINIQPYRDDQCEYEEIEIIEVTIAQENQFRRIAEIIMRAIPYPMVIQFTCQDRFLLVVGEPRINLSDNSKLTIDEFIFTDWIAIDHSSIRLNSFGQAIHVNQLSSTNFFRLYHDLVDQFIRFNATKYIENNLLVRDTETVRANYDQIKTIEKGIGELKSLIKSESQFNRQVELNVEIKKLEKEKIQGIKRLGADEELE
jgi:hypothetical protein